MRSGIVQLNASPRLLKTVINELTSRTSITSYLSKGIMEDISKAARRCTCSFKELILVLGTAKMDFRELMSPDDIEREAGRFNIWCGSLGKLRSGDLGLPESTTLGTTLTKLLQQLDCALTGSIEVASEARLPLEKLPAPEPQYYDIEMAEIEDTPENDDDERPNELSLHMSTIRHTVADLYVLSNRTQANSSRLSGMRNTQSLLHREGTIDFVENSTVRSAVDERYFKNTLLRLRMNTAMDIRIPVSYRIGIRSNIEQYLIDRLIDGANHRRKVFRGANYARENQEAVWGRLVSRPCSEEPHLAGKMPSAIPEVICGMVVGDIITTHPVPDIDLPRPIDETLVELPAAPQRLPESLDFQCPFCKTNCPARYGKARTWRTHILRDLKPYFCPRQYCPSNTRIYSTYSEWLEHERENHQRVWHCFECKELKFTSPALFKSHLQSEHADNITEQQIDNLVHDCFSFESTTPRCLFCHMDGPFQTGIEEHMALHMEVFAAFAAVPEETLGKPGLVISSYIPGEGIAKEVITADIQHYLGPDAFVMSAGIKGGYNVQAPSALTPQMIVSLKQDSERWYAEGNVDILAGPKLQDQRITIGEMLRRPPRR